MPTRHPRWPLLAGLLVFPFTAILHHLVFYRPTCILNPFGADYTPRVVVAWLRNDPSLIWASAAAITVYMIGQSAPRVRPWIAHAAGAFLIGFLPLTIWIWDIPGTGRTICYHFHDGRAGIHTRHLYLLGAAVFCGVLAVQWLRDRRAPSHLVAVIR